ncbi:hypothetical protein CLV84_4337 [Neolewinella xylanilytica]|uniref:Uncharacterized protein n=1 Tax=Neolewinella xylanilytica TaxID=1514080 RepID=A0A2S6HZM4_9BACT|nr:hypothetical protein [Neolewinella xylanilytica]PPK83791.1 hypothetical protein CLV84_4337 [Neolewinella xylanilytica]
MDVELGVKINLADCSLSSFDCDPGFFDNNLYFAHPCIDRESVMPNGLYSKKISIFRIDTANLQVENKSIKFRHSEPYKFKIYDSKQWNFSKINLDIILHVGVSINVDTLQVVSFEKSPRVSSGITDTVRFDDYLIEYNGRSTVACKMLGANKIIWQIKLIGYLYTAIEKIGNTVFWGTAGKGGGFYAVDLESGKILTLYENGDASNYEWYDGNVLLKNKKGDLLLLNPYSSQEITTLSLNGQVMGNRISVFGNRAVVLSHSLNREFTILNWVKLR